ncbi:MAG TPA: hypothetical protein VLD84_07715 [Nitrososphaeraceae archaeon]|nr:hypothetical protein [Nitrososphaeraceae archaeon]
MGKTSNSFNNFYNQFALTSVHNTIKISIIVYSVLAIIVIDTSLNQNSEMRFHLQSSGFSVALFVVLGMIVIGGQFYVLEFVRQKSSQIRKKVAYLRISYKIVFLIQYLVISIFVFVLIQIIFMQQYSPIALTIVTTLTYGLTIGLMGIFTIIFFSWYKSNRNSIVILIYGLSFAAVVIASTIFLTGSLYRLVEKPLYISPDALPPLIKSEPGSLLYGLAKIYHYSDIVSFLLKWVATALLLYHYSQKTGKTKYWILISLPLVYFAGTYLDDYHLYEPHIEIEELYWDLYTSLNSTAGGILFYIGFVLAARHFHGNMAVKDYLIMCGFGFLLFFSAGQSTLANTLYPPFGLATMSLYGLATYMILLGLYSCAISVSEDIELRKSIKKSSLRESKFLDSMGTAHMEKDLTKKMVLKAKEEQKERLQESGGVKSSLTEDDIMKIIEEAEKDPR